MYTRWKEPKIATADIECYKTVSLPKSNYSEVIRIKGNPDHFKSMFFQQDWYIGSTYKVDKFDMKPGKYRNIEHGFHSYARMLYAVSGCNYVYNKAVLKCIIPKGTRYYKSEGKEEYCSESLKVVGWRYYDEWKWRS